VSPAAKDDFKLQVGTRDGWLAAEGCPKAACSLTALARHWPPTGTNLSCLNKEHCFATVSRLMCHYWVDREVCHAFAITWKLTEQKLMHIVYRVM